jgi:LmbE family N-acetylglucosaminyl deacetylase
VNILVIVAHPDDPEFFAGGTIAHWASQGHHVTYVLVTDGSKGTDDPTLSAARLAALRQTEQRAAAAQLGVTDVHFLTFVDGELVNNADLQRAVARAVRQFKPELVVTTDPQTLHYGASRVNHNDHRVMGMAVCDGIFPASGNRMYFPELLAEGYEMHTPRELWFAGPVAPNQLVDITPHMDTKVRAILAHMSQVKQPEGVGERMRQGATRIRADGSVWLGEAFRRVIL